MTITHPLDAHGRPVRLTPCQVTVFRLLREGLRPTEMAARLQCSIYTVRMHIRRVNALLDAHSYYASLLLAEQLGLLDR